MFKVKEQAFLMKEAIQRSEMHKIGPILHNSWENKKKMASGISNETIDNIYATALEAGATGGKISGAGGGGFMIFYCDNNNRYNVIAALEAMGGVVRQYEFNQKGLTTWTTEQK
jgi:D-glycero-alpha-D-manno-heptose-7-phosphate kinase